MEKLGDQTKDSHADVGVGAGAGAAALCSHAAMTLAQIDREETSSKDYYSRERKRERKAWHIDPDPDPNSLSPSGIFCSVTDCKRDPLHRIQHCSNAFHSSYEAPRSDSCVKGLLQKGTF